MKFLGFETHDDVPDARTIWLFAETLIADEAVAKLFARFDAMLQADGFQASGGQSSMPPLAKRRASAPDATTTRRSRKAEFPPIGATKRRRIIKDTRALDEEEQRGFFMTTKTTLVSIATTSRSANKIARAGAKPGAAMLSREAFYRRRDGR